MRIALAFCTVVTTLLACALTGCSRTSSPEYGPAHELRIGIVSDPRSLNPLFVTAESDVDIGQLYTETLVGLSPSNTLIPLLANPVPTRTNAGISPDGLSITYHLRPEARFADGVPVTSKDVAFTYRAILDPRNPVSSSESYRRIASLRTPDAHTVVVHLKHPWVAAVSELFAVSDWVFGILPAHAFTSTDVSHAGWNEHPFGSGPFIVQQWRHGDEIVLVPNRYAWRRPHLDRLLIEVLPDQETLFVSLQTHAIDVATLNEDQIESARRLPAYSVSHVPQNHTIYVEFQVQRTPISDPLVRRALVEAIDRERIARNVFLGYEPLAASEIPPIFDAHDASMRPPRYDPRAAAADLEHAGWHLRNGVRYKDGRPLTLLFAYVSTSLQARRLALVYQDDLARVGISLVVKGYPATTFFGAAGTGGIERGGNFDVAYTEWYGGSDPEESEFFICAYLAPDGPNTSRWCNRRYDALYARQTTEREPAERRSIFLAMQHIVRSGLPGDFLVTTSGYTATSDRVRGWAPNMLVQYGNSQDWNVSP